MKALLVFLLLVSSSALADRDFAIESVAHTQGALMANPPMPMLFASPGESELTFKPAYFEASNEASQNVDPKRIEYTGSGLTVSYAKQWSSRLGLLVSIAGHTLSGDFWGPGDDPNDATERVFAKDVQAQFFQFGLMMNYNLFRSTGLSLPVFIGPVVSSTKLSQTIVQNDLSDPDDFDMNMDVTTTGYVAGIQMGLAFSKAVIINPYFVVTGFFDEGDKCQEYTSTVRTSGNLFDLSDPNCQDGLNSSTSSLEYDIATSSLGLNIVFPPIGLSVNAYAQTGSVPFFEGVEMTLLQLSLVF